MLWIKWYKIPEAKLNSSYKSGIWFGNPDGIREKWLIQHLWFIILTFSFRSVSLIQNTGGPECLSLSWVLGVSPIITIYPLSCKWWGYPGPKSYPRSSHCSQPEKGLSIWLEKHSKRFNSQFSMIIFSTALVSLDTPGKLNIWNHADKMCKQKLVADIISLGRNIDNSFVTLYERILKATKYTF